MNLASILLPAKPLPSGKARTVTFDDDRKQKSKRKQQLSASHRAWYQRNAERERAKRRARYAANREKDKELNRAWRAKNRERTRIIGRLWARKKRAEQKAMGLTCRGTPRKTVNPGHFKSGHRKETARISPGRPPRSPAQNRAQR